MKKKSKLKIVIPILFVLIILAACKGQPGEVKDDSEVAKKSSELVQEIAVISAGTLTTLDSTRYDDVYSSDTIGQIIEGLYRIDGNNELELGIAAAEPAISQDGLIYTFKLKETSWSNGAAVTAADFVYAYRRNVDPNTGSQNVGSFGVIKNGTAISKGDAEIETLGIKAIDEKTLEITLETPIAYFTKLLTGTRFLPINEKFATELGKEYGTTSENVISNGPFKISDWTGLNDTWTLSKNTNYWDAENVKLTQIKVSVIKEIATAVNLFDAGEVQFTTIADEYAKQKEDSPEYGEVPKALVGSLTFNNEREITGNPRVRRAIAQGIDKETFVTNILSDGSTALNGLIPKAFTTNPRTALDYREEIGDLLAFNIEAAQQEWALAKEELGLETISLELLSADFGIAKKTVEYIQGQLETNLPGLRITIKSVPLAQRLDLNRSGDYDIYFGTWTPDYADPYDFLKTYLQTGSNFARYHNLDYEKLLEEAMGELATKPDERWQNLVKAEQILIQEEAAIAPIYQGSIAYLEAENVHDIQLLPFGRSVSYRLAYVK